MPTNSPVGDSKCSMNFNRRAARNQFEVNKAVRSGQIFIKIRREILPMKERINHNLQFVRQADCGACRERAGRLERKWFQFRTSLVDAFLTATLKYQSRNVGVKTTNLKKRRTENWPVTDDRSAHQKKSGENRNKRSKINALMRAQSGSSVDILLQFTVAIHSSPSAQLFSVASEFRASVTAEC